MAEHHDRETVVVERDRGSGGMATLLGIVVIIALLGAVWYFTMGPGAGGSTTQEGGGTNTTPSLAVPSEPAAS